MNRAEKERLNFNVCRFDHYYDSINNKIAVYITINTFLLGGVAGMYLTINEKILYFRQEYEFLIIWVSILGLLTILALIYSSLPYLSHKSSSLYYFGTIASNTLERYVERSKKNEEAEDVEDLREQVYYLSKGLVKKYKIIRWAGCSMLSQIMILIGIAIIIFNNKI